MAFFEPIERRQSLTGNAALSQEMENAVTRGLLGRIFEISQIADINSPLYHSQITPLNIAVLTETPSSIRLLKALGADDPISTVLMLMKAEELYGRVERLENLTAATKLTPITDMGRNADEAVYQELAIATDEEHVGKVALLVEMGVDPRHQSDEIASASEIIGYKFNALLDRIEEVKELTEALRFPAYKTPPQPV